MHTLINADCLDYLSGNSQTWATCFCDPPDNIGLGYQTYKDKLPDEQYVDLLSTWLHLLVYKAKTVWFSHNAKWSFEVGRIVSKCSAGPWTGSQALRPDLHLWTALPPRSGKQPPPAAAVALVRCAAAAQRHPRAELAARERRQAGRPARPGARRRVRLHSRRGQQQATPPLAPNATQRGLGRAMREAHHPRGRICPRPIRRTGTTLRVCRPLGYPAT